MPMTGGTTWYIKELGSLAAPSIPFRDSDKCFRARWPLRPNKALPGVASPRNSRRDPRAAPRDVAHGVRYQSAGGSSRELERHAGARASGFSSGPSSYDVASDMSRSFALEM
ncbi:hypothetical protein EVAR_11657_1 [Eumeta japonica]|uniref:Uncharacterized protein n=1 Tax=Eumeta variegata TaxID=151549 RepID=A0A4C1U4J7_EUMVA|nr:hypothetical protein EVAR_11657_1 [Eumeta japonica]